ncbi:putative Glucan endo-1,3-beta-glucosidase [Quillaja saponaria]|uniref:glucan endo-1,3-beta-D-glucosidase n=1 Tax=Quillaja saponaria TaxID=32244 RepID=A0AAD7VM75_QUISA|nr:putative Glucan endo-1,3-beta-glucosidase [Quillaja saponaria]
MASCFLCLRVLVLFLTLSDSFVLIFSHGVGINYGQIANNLPSPSRVSVLLQSLNISRVKLYDADPNVLAAFSNSNVEFIIGLGNEYLQNTPDPLKAQTWIQQHVQPYLSLTRITCITVGNEVFSGNDTQAMSNLLPAMKTVHDALVNLGLDKQVSRYHCAFSYHFSPNQGMIDPNTNLHYDNMLFAQLDAVYAAIKAMGHTDIEVRISETGWPSKGDPNEAGATPENAGLYNGNLLKIIEEKQGTPGNPSVPIDIHVFALFNEDLKPWSCIREKLWPLLS